MNTKYEFNKYKETLIQNKQTFFLNAPRTLSQKIE